MKPRLNAALIAFALSGFPAGAQQGQLDASEPLFTVMAALNCAGFDAESRSPSNSPLRAEVVRAIESRNPPVLAELKKFYEEHRRDDAAQEISQYISYALILGEAPLFKPKVSGQNVPPDALALSGLDKLLARFYDEAGIATLWKQSQPAFEQVIARYHEPVTQAVLDANAYLKNPTSGFRGKRFQIYIDLLAPPNQIHTRSYGDDYYVVITPSAETKVNEIRAAYLHYLLDPLSMRYAANWEKKKALGDFAQASPILDEAYKTDFVLLGGMCLTKAVHARLSAPPRRQALVDQAMREGFILTEYFYQALPAYEKQDQSMRLYLPAMIDGINLEKEDQRIAKIEFVSQREVHKIKPPAPPPPPEVTGVEKEVQAAEALYEKRDLPAAKEAYRRIAQSSAPKPVHARAYYGLARIAALEKNPELSEQLFQQTLELEPEPGVKAWTHVYLGRLSQAAQEPAEARKQYEAALAVSGASEAAVNAARKGLASVASPRDK